jgi:cyclophilin family peptidyl-prolyl cis-trans isomerase/HEAT repeat protein
MTHSAIRASRFVVLAALLLLPACAPRLAMPPAEFDVPPRHIVLEDDEIAAIAELLAMEDRRLLDIERIRLLLGHPGDEVRARAALAVGRVRQPGSEALLHPLLDDASPHVRASAAFAAGLRADTTALPLLRARALDPAGRHDGVEAIGALWRIGTTDAAATVEQILAASLSVRPPPRTHTAEALLAVWRMPRSDAAVEHVVRLAASDDDEIRWRASHALMRMGAPGTAPALLAMLRQAPDPLSRAQAARGLRPAFADSAGLLAETRQALQDAMVDPHPHVRLNAVRSFGSFAGAADVPTIARLLADPDSNVVLSTVETLATPRLNPLAREVLRQVARDMSARPVIRLPALTTLIRAGDAEALDIAGSWLAGNEQDRLQAIRALAPAGPAAESLFLRLSRDPQPEVAAAAISALAALPAPAGPSRPLLLESLRHPHPAVRAAAARALQSRAEPADLPALLDAWAAAAGDPTTAAALATVDALGALAEANPAVARSFFLRFPEPHADRAVHARVVARIGDARWPAPPPAPRRPDHGAAYYEDIVRRYVAPHLAGTPLPRVVIETEHGDIVMELAASEAPLTVANFLALVDRNFYDGIRWHRVVPNFVLQTGQGSNGPAWSIRDEINRLRFDRGTLGMALSGPDTGTSQWFITHAPQPHLDGGYTVFGRVIGDMHAADNVVQDDVVLRIRRLPPEAN